MATRNELDLFEKRQNATTSSEIQKIRTAQDYMADIKKASQEKQIASKERDQRRRKVLVDVIESKLKNCCKKNFKRNFIKILLRSKMKIEIGT